ncbi:MAG: efflux transporter periplasmic adaptor subunit [Candidatus Angelobacter sp.]|jgi:RND family efflux transporter MFP subunit|nr:efflux transporter periplasmic adaptor subunit [Candidatus Angelobacter sp.]
MFGVSMQQKTELEPLRAAGDEKKSHKGWIAVVIVLLLVAGVLTYGIVSRIRAKAALSKETAKTAVPPVSVVPPKPSTPAQDIILPGNVEPFIASPIYAQTTGYLKKWYFDIGAHVKKGQLLAVVDSPAVDQQYAQARSNLSTAEANLRLAEITKNRYLGLLKTHAVAQQDADNAVGTYNANKAIVDANRANVQQFQVLKEFERVYAPFDGVITARNTDIGDLITSGSTAANNSRTDLFHISQPGKLRVYVNVPEEYSRGVKPGMTAQLALAEFPGRQFQGVLVRTAEAINMTTRTLLIEVQVDNPTNTLLTGSYAEVHLKVPDSNPTFVIPVNTLIFRAQGLHVGVVKDGKAVVTPVTAGRDFGNTIEIVHGLNAGDQIIVNPSDSLVTGQAVQTVQASLPGDLK